MTSLSTNSSKQWNRFVHQLKYFFRYQVSQRKWKPIDNIGGHNSYAQAGQDLFVLAMTGFKERGTYIEVGAQDPIRYSNTFILEQRYQWTGLSLELREDYGFFFNRLRRNPCIVGDAIQANYPDLIKKAGLGNVIDYLQIDIDPAENSLRVLESMPFSEQQFAVITFEHDAYSGSEAVANASRDLLALWGYSPVALDVCYGGLPFEDWWYHPEVYRAPMNLTSGCLYGKDYREIVLALLADDV